MAPIRKYWTQVKNVGIDSAPGLGRRRGEPADDTDTDCRSPPVYRRTSSVYHAPLYRATNTGSLKQGAIISNREQ